MHRWADCSRPTSLAANLPYIPTATLPTLPVAASFEPRAALDGGSDGLDLITPPDRAAARSRAAQRSGIARDRRRPGRRAARAGRATTTWLVDRDTRRPGRPATCRRVEASRVTAQVLAAADPASLQAARAALERGELIGIPTETVYGVCALPTAAGVARLIEAKQRSADKGIQLLVDSLEQVAGLVPSLTPTAERLARRFWPGGADPRPRPPHALGLEAARAARRRAADARPASARPRGAACAGASPRPAGGELGQRQRPSPTRTTAAARCGQPRRRPRADPRRRPGPRRHAVDCRGLLVRRWQCPARSARGRDLLQRTITAALSLSG